MIRVHISGHLKDFTGRKREIDLQNPKDILELVKELEGMFPGIKARILDDQDKTRMYVNIFVNGENSRDVKNEKTALKDGDVIHILPSVAGG